MRKTVSIAIQQMADEYSREDVACTMKQAWNLVVVQMEVGAVEVVVASYGILAINLTTGNQGRLTAYLTQFIEQIASLAPADAFHLDGGVGKITGLRIVGKVR